MDFPYINQIYSRPEDDLYPYFNFNGNSYNRRMKSRRVWSKAAVDTSLSDDCGGDVTRVVVLQLSED